MMEVVQPRPHVAKRSMRATAGFKSCFDLIACSDIDTRKTAIMLVHAYGSTKCPSPSTTKMKYFCATVMQSKSIGLLGFASMLWSISATKREKKAESLSKKLLGPSELNAAKTMQTK